MYEDRKYFSIWLRLELNSDFGLTVMANSKPCDMTLNELVRSCQPLFSEDGVSGSYNSAASAFAYVDPPLPASRLAKPRTDEPTSPPELASNAKGEDKDDGLLLEKEIEDPNYTKYKHQGTLAGGKDGKREGGMRYIDKLLFDVTVRGGPWPGYWNAHRGVKITYKDEITAGNGTDDDDDDDDDRRRHRLNICPCTYADS